MDLRRSRQYCGVVGRSVAAALLVVLALGCGAESPRGVDVEIDADACLRAATASISVRALTDDGVPIPGQELVVDEGLVFPTGVRVLAAIGDSQRFTIEITAWDAAGTPLAFARHHGTFPTEATLDGARVLLDDRCLGHVCTETGACSEGACVASADAPTRPARLTGSARCPGHAFVRAEGDGDCSSPTLACADVETALSYLGAAGGIVDVHGGGAVVLPSDDRCESPTSAEPSTYPGFTIPDGLGAILVRGWPGTGRPRIDGTGLPDAIRVEGVATIDGLEITAGRSSCVYFLGKPADGLPRPAMGIRRSYVHGCGRIAASPIRTGIRMGVDSRDSVNAFVDDNLVRGSGIAAATGTTTAAYLERMMGLQVRRNTLCQNVGPLAVLLGSANLTENVVYGSTTQGILVRNAFSLEAHDNVVCRSTGVGLYLDGGTSRWTATRNTLARNDVGVRFQGGADSTLRHNILAFNRTFGAVRSAATIVHRESRNLYWLNPTHSNFPASEALIADPLFLDECGHELEEGTPADGPSPNQRYGAR